MTKVTNKSKLNIGDIVKHEYRKTLTFKVTEVSPRVKIRRCNKAGDINERFKGYGLAPRDFSQGLITLVSKAVVEAKDPEVFYSKIVKEEGITVDQLESSTPFNELSNIINEFRKIECDLSPENLTCDGEASAYYVRKKKKELLSKWALLEQYVGRKVLAEV